MDAPSLRLSRDSLGHKAADVLRHQILTGELAAGTRLVEDDLASLMGTSRGPLRDAFALLAREGLVSTTQGKGTYVKGITAASLRALYDVRILLEVHAAGLAAQNTHESASGQMRELVKLMTHGAHTGDQAEYVRADEAIHRTIWELTGNEHLINVLEYLIVPCLAWINLNAQLRSSWPFVVEAHRQLVDAVIAGDSASAMCVMRDTLLESLDHALAGITTSPGEH